MTDYFRRHLGAKLLLSYLAIILVGVLVLILASQFVLPTTFNRHMGGMGMMDGGMMHTPGSGPGAGNQGQGSAGRMSQVYTDFRASFNEALLYAALASDNRNWDAIRAWANALPAQLQHSEVLQPA